MTPNLPLPSRTHLSEQQLDALLFPHAQSDPHTSSAEAHLAACEQCTAELSSLRESLGLFRQASTAYAGQQLRSLPPLSIAARRLTLQPTYWVLAAATLFLAAILPMQMLNRNATPAPVNNVRVAENTAISNEALLDSVSNDLSESVPSPMRALAEPADSSSPSPDSISSPDSTQRKD